MLLFSFSLKKNESPTVLFLLLQNNEPHNYYSAPPIVALVVRPLLLLLLLAVVVVVVGTVAHVLAFVCHKRAVGACPAAINNHSIIQSFNQMNHSLAAALVVVVVVLEGGQLGVVALDGLLHELLVVLELRLRHGVLGHALRRP